MELDKQAKRAFRALEAAQNSAQNASVRSHLEDIQLYVNKAGVYATAADGTGTIAATGNWNSVDFYDKLTRSRVVYEGDGTLPKRLLRVLEKLGIECEWSDEWSTCDDCGKLVRTQPDSYVYEPYFTCSDDGLICKDCQPETDKEETDD